MNHVSLSAHHQAINDLPSGVSEYLAPLVSIERVPNLYEDSTHQIWCLQTPENVYALKVCPANLYQLKTAIFWRGVQYLWGLDLPKQLGGYAEVYGFLTKHSGLQVPPLIQAQSSENHADAWLLNAWLPGLPIKWASDKLIKHLANHLVQLHSQTQPFFGGLIGEAFSSALWGQKLLDTLNDLAAQHQVVLPLSESAVQALIDWVPHNCVPVMLDLRWDQFLQSENGDLTTLVDCDAFVWAPSALALLQVEFMLSETEMHIFKAEYEKSLPWPSDLQGERRTILWALLSLLNVFGSEALKPFAKL